ncbi:Uncharacterised protein [Mycobacterium tuberculosis]|nr:Uncharacterised protein [Mycobacterium tuberculosis]
MGVSVEQVDRQDHLHQVGADRAVGDLDTDRGSRRARGVLQVGYGVDVQLDRDEQLPLAVGYLIDDEDCRLSQARNVVQKTFNGVFRRRRREYDRWLRIAKCRIKTLGVTRQFGCEQRHRDGACLDCSVEPANIVDALWCEDRNAVAGACEPLHVCTYGR